jgi:hypothetical protein
MVIPAKVLTSRSKLVPAAVVGRCSGWCGLKRALKALSEMERESRPAGRGLGGPHPWKTCVGARVSDTSGKSQGRSEGP